MTAQHRKLFVTKASGATEPFSAGKLLYSLKVAGASPKRANEIVEEVRLRLKSGVHTRDIHRMALEFLEGGASSLPARYNLKQALLELGPTGHPFETFVGHVFVSLGYRTQIRQMIRGRCVAHEVDVVARKGNEHIVVEVKFHNHPGFKTDVKTVLYVKARFDDIVAGSARRPHVHQIWLVTNTKFTSEAVTYALCSGIQLLGWNYPVSGSLQRLAEDAGLIPITALTTLSAKNKQQLLSEGTVLCRQLSSERPLSGLSISSAQRQAILREAEAVMRH